MITHTSKKKKFVITALLCDLCTSIYAWQRRIYIHKSSVRSPPPLQKYSVCNPGIHILYASMGGILLSIVIVCMRDGTSNRELCRHWPKTFTSACTCNSFFAELNVC